MWSGGDTIKIDTGNYLLGATIVMTTNDVGAAGTPIVIMGSTNGTTINRQNTGYDAFYLQGAEYVQFRNLKFTGGRYGLSGDGTTANYLRGVEILNCETMTNGTHGFNFSYTSNLVVSASSMHHNGQRGASLGGGRASHDREQHHLLTTPRGSTWTPPASSRATSASATAVRACG